MIAIRVEEYGDIWAVTAEGEPMTVAELIYSRLRRWLRLIGPR